VKKYLGFNKVAEYSVALNIILLLLEPIKMLGGAMQSYFAGMAHLTDEIKSRFFVFYKHYTWLAIFSGVSLWVEAEPIVSFVYTSKYASSAGLVKVLLLGFIPGVCAHLMMHLFVGLKRTRYLVIQDIIVAALFGSLLLFSFSYMTIETVSTIKAFSFMVSFAMAIWYIQVRMKFPFPLFEMIKSLGLSIMLLGVFSLIPGNHIGMILLRIMLAFALYFMLSIQLGLIEMRILQNVMGEFKRILGVDKR
jgi:O-antigen/teichoic acid export membrane protein